MRSVEVQFLFRPLSADVRTVAAIPNWDVFADFIDRPGIEATQSRYEVLLNRWAEIHGLKRSDLSQEADIEDWIENAVKLVAAVDAGLPCYVLERTAPTEPLKIASSINAATDFDPAMPTIFNGTVLRWDPCFARGSEINMVWPPRGCLGVGGNYWNDPILLKALGRPAAVSSGDSDGENGYISVTRNLREMGAKDLLAKIIFQTKYQAPTRLSLMPDADDRDISNAFITAFEENLLDCEGRPQCFLIQEVRPLLHEYRIIVIGGRPVAGAGTVEWLNPIFHDPADGDFNPLVESRRNDRSLVRSPDVVTRYVDRANELCRKLEASGSTEFNNCTMDFAIDAETNEVLLVETNPPDNFGLYAMNYSSVMRPMIDEAKKAIIQLEDQAERKLDGVS